jgi:hypothetical protein
MVSSIETFEQAKQLDPAALRRLLVSDRPEQRVWAMWGLALRQQGVPDIVQRTAVEPDPGVRRTLAVVLASHGETDLLVALARHDPAIAVRASAMQLVTRLAAGGAIHRSVVLEAAQREPEIQAAILAAIDASAPEFLVAIAVEVVQHGAPGLQIEAFEALMRVGTPASVRRAIGWLGAASPGAAVEACGRWARTETPEAVVRMLASAPAELREVALQALRSASWSVVEPLIGGDPALLLRAGYHAHPQLPIEVLARLVMETASLPALTALVRRLEAMLEAPPGLVPLLPDLRDHALRRQQELHSQDVVALRAEPPRRAPAIADGSTPDGRAAARREIAVQRAKERKQLALLWLEIRRLRGDGDPRAPETDRSTEPDAPGGSVRVPGSRAAWPKRR